MENFQSAREDVIECKGIYPTTREPVFFGMEIASFNPYTNDDCNVNEESTLIR